VSGTFGEGRHVRELTYSQPQTAIAIVFVIISIVLVGVFIAVARSARHEVEFETVKKVGYGIRTRWFVGLATVLTAGVVASLFLAPYPSARGSAQRVTVTGGQFYWAVSPKTITAGRVEFQVTSADVNHGLGIYGPDGGLVGSVQAMPGYTNRLVVRFDEPGEYQFLCLELCGIAHHNMHATFAVTAR
jgi:cytochrome c oxidase subunit 2